MAMKLQPSAGGDAAAPSLPVATVKSLKAARKRWQSELHASRRRRGRNHYHY